MNGTRRDFLKKLGALVAGAAMIPISMREATGGIVPVQRLRPVDNGQPCIYDDIAWDEIQPGDTLIFNHDGVPRTAVSSPYTHPELHEIAIDTEVVFQKASSTGVSEWVHAHSDAI